MGRGDKHFSKDIIETQIQKDICIPMFTATLFTILKIRKQCTCPSIDEWLKAMWCIYMQWNIMLQ